MAYAQATLTSANAANDFVTVLDGLLTDEGWTVVETLTPSGNLRNRIYKSDGASNACGYDWFVIVRWTTVGTENFVEVWSALAYDSGTHIASGITMGANVSSGSNLRTTDASGYIAASTTINLSTTGVSTSKTRWIVYEGPTGGSPKYSSPGFQTLIPSSAFAYWMSVTLDHVGLFTTVATNYQNSVMGSLDIDAGYASNPLFADGQLVSWQDDYFMYAAGFIGIAPNISNYRGQAVAYSGTFGSKLPALSDAYMVAYAWKPDVYISAIGGSGTTPPWTDTSAYGMILVGTVIDFYLVYGGSVGDTVTIGGATYVLTGSMDTSNQVTANEPAIALLVE